MKNQLIAFLAFVFLLSLSACNTGKKNKTSTEPKPVSPGMGWEKPQGEVEEKTAWIGPKKIEVQCWSPLAPPSCREMRHQVQFGELDKNGDWEPFYDFFEIPNYEEGYIYQVEYTKNYYSDEQLQVLADHAGYEVTGIVVISKKEN